MKDLNKFKILRSSSIWILLGDSCYLKQHCIISNQDLKDVPHCLVKRKQCSYEVQNKHSLSAVFNYKWIANSVIWKPHVVATARTHHLFILDKGIEVGTHHYQIWTHQTTAQISTSLMLILCYAYLILNCKKKIKKYKILSAIWPKRLIISSKQLILRF